MNAKFKVGDEVRLIHNEYSREWYIPETVFGIFKICKVNFIRNEITYNLEGQTLYFPEKCLEKVKNNNSINNLTLPTDSNERKNYPVLSGCVKYFPAAIAGVSKISKLGNDKHNPGQPLHHNRGKSGDHGDCIIRHLIDTEDLLAAYKRDDSSVTKEMILTEVNQMAWRALAYSQEINEELGAPLAPGAK